MKSLYTIAIVLLTLGLTGAGDASDKLAEQRARAFIEQISAPPLDDYSEFIDTHLAPEMIARRGPDDMQEMLGMLSRNHGAIAIESIESDGTEIRIVGQDSAGMWLRFEFQFEPGAARRIAGFGVQMAPPPRDPQQPKAAQSDWVREFGDFLRKRAEADAFSGTVIIASGSEPIYAKAFGLADRERNIANTLDTPINLGSMNKMFTGLAIAQLVERGKLGYGDTVGKHLPDYPNETVRNDVTIHQLLTHTAGLGQYWNEAYETRRMDLRTTADFAALFQDEPLASAPGARFHYSNSGPVVLGLIIEAVTGMDYYSYVRKHIYDAAGMTRSGHFEIGDEGAGFATGYDQAPGAERRTPNTATMGRRGSPAGGGYSSANDMLRFSVALMGSRLLASDQRDVLLQGKVPMGPDARYAYLFGDHVLNGHRYVGHNGGAPGISAAFSVFPELGYTVIVLSNYGRAALPVVSRARELIAYNN